MSVDGEEPPSKRIKYDDRTDKIVLDMCRVPRVLACDAYDYHDFVSGEAEHPDLRDLIATVTFLSKGEDAYRRLIVPKDEYYEYDGSSSTTICELKADSRSDRSGGGFGICRMPGYAMLSIDFQEHDAREVAREKLSRGRSLSTHAERDLVMMFDIQPNNAWNDGSCAIKIQESDFRVEETALTSRRRNSSIKFMCSIIFLSSSKTLARAGTMHHSSPMPMINAC